MKNFVLIGAAGYIAPRHMEAIRNTGNNLIAAIDPHDSVGVLDRYFPKCDFFTEFERFDRHCEKLKRKGTKIDYVVVCSPNYLHDAHCRFGLRIGADVICEKPVVLNPWNLEALLEMENETGLHIYPVFQMRYQPEIIALKDKVAKNRSGKRYEVQLIYNTPRGKWYHYSWKGDINKSGGIATNIGIHFFDLLLWIFGQVNNSRVHTHTSTSASGELTLEAADVKWMMSLHEEYFQQDLKQPGVIQERILKIDGEEIHFNFNTEALHTQAYQAILDQKGISLVDTLASHQVTQAIRSYKY